MHRSTLAVWVLAGFLAIGAAASPTHADDGFKPIFDGKTLDGWHCPDMSYWSVEDGAITARSTPDHPCKKNQFLVWTLGELDDFELKLKFRISGDKSANAGIQVRSAIKEDGHAEGYQADIDLAGKWVGALYDEHTGRRLLAERGQKVKIGPDGRREMTSRRDPTELMKHVKAGEWNEYHIIAHGGHLTLRINGYNMCEVIDDETAHRDLQGKLALQLHSGPPMTVQYKDIMLKRLPLADGRKKLVLVAGAPSHGSGAHEFNAGIKILKKRLDNVGSVIAANYHDHGWPKDPTAFDNADGIVLYMDGWKGHPVNNHLEAVDAMMSRGVGLMCMHYAVHVDAGTPGEYFKKWIGGYYEDQWSSNPHWDADIKPNQNHPICNGVEPATIHDEWYFNMRFRDGMTGVTTVLEAKPSDETRAMNGWPKKPYPHIIAAAGRSETLMWAVQREDGGRGVGFTGGHWHRNWAHPVQLKAVLNGMLWVAGADVPPKGVEAAEVTVEELNANLDPKKKMARIELPEIK